MPTYMTGSESAESTELILRWLQTSLDGLAEGRQP